MPRSETPNSLIHSHSPYLQQHAYNPVQWREWSTEVWAEAVAQNKPVIVSIGYSACHWCHVMEKESFEDAETAEIMNHNFICIKVDREERPDVDAVYMEACQQMTGRGGWPLNAICLPNQQPLYAGTYFPKQSWQSILLQLKEVFKNDAAKAQEYGIKITQAINGNIQHLQHDFSSLRSRNDIYTIAELCEKDFDYNHGGNLRVPKFIVPCFYRMLLDIYLLTKEKSLLDFLNFTFIKILNGGIFDHLRGGFYRYSTDENWKVPHFEKMLYDNAQMLGLLTVLNRQSNLDLFKEGVDQTLDFCNTELKEEQGYCAALDADSEGIEGRYYCFFWEEVNEVLDERELQFATDYFGLSKEGNWEHGMNILHRPYAPAQLLEMQNISATEYYQLSVRVHEKLLKLQNTRTRPGKDNKVLAGWNGLMLSGLSQMGISGNHENAAQSLENLTLLIKENFIDKEGFLLRTYTNKITGFAEDYANVANGFWEAYLATANENYLSTALQLLEKSMELFFRKETGMFAFTQAGTEQLFAENYDTTDDTIPSSNATLCALLLKMGMLLNRGEWIVTGTQMVNKMQDRILKLAPWYSVWAANSFLLSYGGLHVAVSGNGALDAALQLQQQLPSFVPVVASETPQQSALEIFKGHPVQKTLFIQICNFNQCFEPVSQPGEALEILEDLLSI